MAVLNMLCEGALAAAELLALLLVPPAQAAPSAPAPPHAVERVQVHRLSTSVDVRLLGTLAEVRITQHLRNAGSTVADLGAHLPAVDERADTLRVVRGNRAVELLASVDAASSAAAGRARLSRDEAIADALQLPPGAEAIVEVIGTQPLERRAGVYRVALPFALDAAAPRATLVEQDSGMYLVVVPHRPAAAASIVLRPTSGDSRWLNVGPVDARTAVLIPLRGRMEMDDVAEGAIEIELVDGRASHWSTVVAQRAGQDAPLQTRTAE